MYEIFLFLLKFYCKKTKESKKIVTIYLFVSAKENNGFLSLLLEFNSDQPIKRNEVHESRLKIFSAGDSIDVSDC